MRIHFALSGVVLGWCLSALPLQAAEPMHESKHASKHESMKLEADVAAFHTALKPLWHAAKGPERISKACEKAGELVRLAQEIKSTDASSLQGASGQFQEQCKTAPDKAEAAFGKVHDAFHKLAMHKHDKMHDQKHEHKHEHGQKAGSTPEASAAHQH